MGSNNFGVETILQSLTLEEKISLLAGQNFWETVPIPGKVPSVKTTDGPNGARGADFTGGTPAACFPAASCVAATFDTSIARRMGEALAEEVHSKGARCLLAPTTCIHRHPLGGRNFESFSEDPLLAGKLASQVIQGLQSRGVAATIKHFAANEQETERLSVDETIDERTLREIYLRPFEIAVKEARPWAVMTAYNSVNGRHCDMNTFHLRKVLRGEWGWSGLVMSDWGGVNSTVESLNAGLDLEMPGPTLRRKVPDVLAALKAGKVSESTINERARNVLEFLEKLKVFEDPITPPEQAIDRPAHRALIREVGAKGCVLLKNEGHILPLSRDRVKGKKIALIGLAKTALAHGGGSASVNAHYKITPWDAMHEAVGDVAAQLTYAQGAQTMRVLPPLSTDGTAGKLSGLDGKPGITLRLFDKNSDEVVDTQHGQPSLAMSPLGGNSKIWKAAEYECDFTPSETGSHYLGCTGLGPTQLFVDDELVYEQEKPAPDGMGLLFGAIAEEEFTYPFVAGRTYRLRVRSLPPTGAAAGLDMLTGRVGLRLGFMLASEHDADLLSEAVAVAKEADYAIVFTGHDPQWETEGVDQASFHLPKHGSLDRLISAVAAANKQTVVVNSTGVAVAMPWLDQVAGLLQTWFPGQECGHSIADVLTGRVNPEGRLPVSFPKRLEDAPAYGNFPGEHDGEGQLRVEYKEGVFVGYRHYDRAGRDKLNFPFGYGLSYSAFDLGQMRVTGKPSADEGLRVSVVVANTGSAAGGTLVQLYGGRAGEEKQEDASAAVHPPKSLVAFQKISLRPGEEAVVHLDVWARDLGFFDVARQLWVVEAGEYEILLAESAADIVQRVPVVVERELTFAP